MLLKCLFYDLHILRARLELEDATFPLGLFFSLKVGDLLLMLDAPNFSQLLQVLEFQVGAHERVLVLFLVPRLNLLNGCLERDALLNV